MHFQEDFITRFNAGLVLVKTLQTQIFITLTIKL